MLPTVQAVGERRPDHRGTSDRAASKKPSPSVSPPPPPPEVGSCRQLTFVDIGRYSNTTPTTPCGKPHTAQTFDVATLPNKIAFEGVQIKNDAIQQRAAKTCRTAFVRYIGGDSATRARVRLTVTYFLPNQAGFDAGARWVRCEIVALKAERLRGRASRASSRASSTTAMRPWPSSGCARPESRAWSAPGW